MLSFCFFNFFKFFLLERNLMWNKWTDAWLQLACTHEKTSWVKFHETDREVAWNCVFCTFFFCVCVFFFFLFFGYACIILYKCMLVYIYTCACVHYKIRQIEWTEMLNDVTKKRTFYLALKSPLYILRKLYFI